jgi:nucleoside-triphosphatase THEP1
VTTEILEKGVRVGFSLEGLNGEQGVLAHVEVSSRFQVGRYGVDVAGCQSFAASWWMPDS